MARTLSRPARLTLCRALSSKLTPLALAWAATAQPALAVEQSFEFNIPPQALSSALNAFADKANVALSYPSAYAADLKSPGAMGRLTIQQALGKLLAGTGLAARTTANGTITLEKLAAPATPVQPKASPAVPQPGGASTLPVVTVVGKLADDSTEPYNKDYALPDAISAMKTDTPIMETPFSVQVVPKEVIRDQQVYSVEKAVQNVAGVTPFPSNGGLHDQFVIRGFSNDSLYRDGFLLPSVLGGGTSKRDPANVERFEVLKGPASVLFGRTEPGGIINLVTKKPQASSYYSLQQQFGSYDFYRTTLDATGAITSDDALLYRANLAYQNAGSFTDFVNSDRVFFAPVLTWNISPATQVNLEVEYLHFNEKANPGIPPIIGAADFGIPSVNRPAPVNRSLFVGEPGHNANNGDRTLVGFNWTHAFNEDWKLLHRFTSEFLDYNTQGLFFYPGADPDGTLYRSFNDGYGETSQRYYNTLNLTGKFDTGPVKHSILLGYDFFQLDDKMTNICCAFAPAFNIFSPRYNNGSLVQDTVNDPNVFVSNLNFTQTWNGLYAQDQMEVYKGIFIMGGMRWDSAQVYNNSLNLTASDDSRVNPRAGVLFRPIKWLSLYGSYSQNFGPSNSFFSTDGGKQAPQTANQWELGAKTEFFDGRLNATLAFYDLTKNNLPAPDPLNPLLTRTIGQAQTRGMEFEVQGEILPGWRVIGAYAYLPDATINTGINAGNRLFLAPEHSGSLWTTYEFEQGAFQGLKFGSGVNGVSQRQGDEANDYQLPGYVTWNLMLGYGLKVGPTRVSAQLNIDNLIDKTYYAGSNSTYQIQFGAPRTFLGSLRVEY